MGALEIKNNNKTNDFVFGIIIPMQDESQYLGSKITNKKNIKMAGIKYVTGKINNKSVVFVNSGLGKINTAAITARLIRDFHPNFILLAGSSGGINPHLTKEDVVIAKTIIDADLGKLTKDGPEFYYEQYLHQPQKNKLLPLRFTLNNSLLKFLTQLKQKAPKTPIIFGKIATSDALPNPNSQTKFLQANAIDVVDMEGAAVAQVCWLFNTPYIIVRGVSNNIKDIITQKDIENAATHAAKTVISIIENYNSK